MFPQVFTNLYLYYGNREFYLLLHKQDKEKVIKNILQDCTQTKLDMKE